VVRALPVVLIEGRSYFRDDRLEEFRAVDNPHDRMVFGYVAYAMLVKRTLDNR
jgi:hypothetical protein